ncbi:tryptophan--tRNA ligase [bacterium]|nr:tryptophan--tRNA ligase [bacterium]
MNKVVLSGIRATSRLHIGNYLGAVKGMLELQENPNTETFYMVADLHAITTPYNKEKLAEQVKDVVKDYLASGLNPEKSTLFIQSAVEEHTVLSNLLSSVVTVARMQHLPTFKEKLKESSNGATMALLNYPILMAADILAYKATHVPVGIDQEPHLEISREIARKINQEYGTDFPEPARYKTSGEYVPSLTGIGKMSKSIEGSAIYLTDDLKQIQKSLSKVPTDIGKGDQIPSKGGVATLLYLVEFYESKQKKEQYIKAYLDEGIRYGDLKKDLALALYNKLKPIQQSRKEYEAKPELLKKIITQGNIKAKERARKSVDELKEKMGF